MANVRELTCAELVELVTDYLEDALDPGSRRRFDAHIAECGHCRAYLDQVRVTVQAAGRLREETLAPEVRAALLEAFRGWRGSPA